MKIAGYILMVLSGLYCTVGMIILAWIEWGIIGLLVAVGIFPVSIIVAPIYMLLQYGNPYMLISTLICGGSMIMINVAESRAEKVAETPRDQ